MIVLYRQSFFLLLHGLSGLFLTFGEDDREIAKKAQTSEPAARAVSLRSYKASEISNRLAGLRANEQYHQMCGRAIIWRTSVLIIWHTRLDSGSQVRRSV